MATITMGKTIYHGYLPTSSAASPGLGVVPADAVWVILEVCLANVDTSDRTIDLSRVPYGGTAGHSNKILHEYSLVTNTDITLKYNTVMTEGDFLSGHASAANAIVCTISGTEKVMS